MKYILLLVGLFTGMLQAQSFQSLYTDVKARQVGDIISVIIVENANASRESKSSNASSTAVNASASVSGDVTKLTPSFGAGTSFGSAYDGMDETEQKDRLTGRITVRIVEQTEFGMFRIKGERKLEVNGEENLMQLEGFIRPRDISTMNTVYSYNIADAKITYRKSGFVNKIMKPGTMPKLLVGVMGGLILAIAGGALIL